MATYVEDIVQALKNLGGEATLNQICDEVVRIRTVPLPKNWKANIRGVIGNHSSASTRFLGPDYFQKVGKGRWALRDQVGMKSPAPSRNIGVRKSSETISSPESFETIANYLKTIKEYREYASPASSSWVEYLQEFFHVMGFSTERRDSRLITLNDMSGKHEPKAIIIYFYPGEDSEEITPELSWESYLMFAANYHHVNWGILTDGLLLKIFNFGEQKNQVPLFWPDLDGIIQYEKLDEFVSIYKAFSFLREQDKTLAPEQENRHDLRYEFWKQLLAQAKTRDPKFANISPRKDNWISSGAGKYGFNYAYVVRMTDAQVELYIDEGVAKTNKRYFDQLYADKIRIEQEFGEPLDWQRLDDKRASRIRYLIQGSGILDPNSWQELQRRMIDVMVKMQRTFTIEIRRLK